MNYLRRVARRLTGLSQENSLRPGDRRWQDAFDPFENWAIAPTTIPLTSKQQDTASQIAPVEHDISLPERKRKDIVQTDKPANNREAEIGSRRESIEITAKDASDRSKTAKTTRNKKSGHPIRARKKTALSDMNADADTGFAGNKSKRLIPVQGPDTSGRRPDDSKADVVPGRSKLFGRLQRKAATGREAADAMPSISKSRQKSDSATAVSTLIQAGPAPLQPAHSKRSPVPAVRRRKPAASRTDAPRLVIGNLKVDVVAVDDKPKPSQTSTPVARKTKPIRARDIGRGTVKMKFGLGQM